MNPYSCGQHGLFLHGPHIVLDASMPMNMCDAFIRSGFAGELPPAIISHAHADHSPSRRSAKVYASPATADLLRARGHTGEVCVMDFGQTCSFPHADVTLYPAGHILGSSMVYIESEHGTILYTGDCRFPPSPVSEGFEWPDRPVDHLIIEATFALPLYRWKPPQLLFDELRSFVRHTLREGALPVLLCYALGKTQEVLHVLAQDSDPVPVEVAPSAVPLCRVYESYGIELGEWGPLRPDGSHDRACITPSREIAEQLSATRPVKTAYISGWAATRNITSGHAIPLSDHIDFFELLDLCQTIAPRHVWLTHSPDPSVALHFLRQAGISCHPLQPQKLPPNLNDVKRVFSAPDLSSISPAHDAGKRDDHAFPFTWQRHGAFALFCETFVPGPHAASPDDTITRYADYLGTLEKEALCLAIRFLTDGPLPPGDKPSGAASQKLLLRTMSRMLDIGIQEVIKPCREAVSHISEAAGILFQNMGGKVLHPRSEGFSLKEVQRLFQHLASMRSPDEKSRALEAMWIQMTPEEIRGSVQILTRTPAQGALIIPFLIRALSAVFDVPVPHLSRHFLKTGRLDAVAALAADRRLADDGTIPKSRVLTASVLYIRSLPGTDASECTLGIRRSPGDSRFVAIANTTMISSLLDGHQLKEKARSYYEERFGPAIRLKPGLMVEVQYAGILENRRKQAGIELFMPEIVRIAEDKDENDAFTLSGLGVDRGL